MAWKKLASEYVHSNPWYKVRRDKVIRPDGKPGVYNVIETRGSVYVVAVDTDLRFLLVKLARYTTGIESYEIPAGGIENEGAIDAAKRELQEEAGLVADKWKKLGVLQAANGISDALANIYLASDLHHVEAHGQSEEGISELLSVSFSEAYEMMSSGAISCAQSIAAITMAAIATGQTKAV